MRLIQHIKASNFLSFGSGGLDLELNDLNVLIGTNGSGKSNFLEIFELLKSLPKNSEDDNNFERIISRGGGPAEWSWKGNKGSDIDFEVITSNLPLFGLHERLKHSFKLELEFFNFGFSPSIENESIEIISKGNREQRNFHILKNTDNVSEIWNGTGYENLNIGTYKETFSILAQRYYNLEISNLANAYERIRLYREWSFGRNTIFRTPQRADLRNDRLESDFSNLGMFLSRLRKDPVIKRALVGGLQDLYQGLTDFEVVTEGGSVQIFFTEGDFSFPAIRLSDGTLRYLCLLAILLDPTPPPLICIEEPELGLHPDVLPNIADLFIQASKRTQLVITTHSDVLVDALSEQPESVLVCEKHEGQTHIKRLDRESLAHWLTDYGLGQLWMRGEIGGKRW